MGKSLFVLKNYFELFSKIYVGVDKMKKKIYGLALAFGTMCGVAHAGWHPTNMVTETVVVGSDVKVLVEAGNYQQWREQQINSEDKVYQFVLRNETDNEFDSGSTGIKFNGGYVHSDGIDVKNSVGSGEIKLKFSDNTWKYYGGGIYKWGDKLAAGGSATVDLVAAESNKVKPGEYTLTAIGQVLVP